MENISRLEQLWMKELNRELNRNGEYKFIWPSKYTKSFRVEDANTGELIVDLRGDFVSLIGEIITVSICALIVDTNELIKSGIVDERRFYRIDEESKTYLMRNILTNEFTTGSKGQLVDYDIKFSIEELEHHLGANLNKMNIEII